MTVHVEFPRASKNNGAICILYCLMVDKRFSQALILMMPHLKIF